MLVPAILYKDKIEKEFQKRMYDSDNSFYYYGYCYHASLPTLDFQDNVYHWAIVNNKKELIGYFAYQTSPQTRAVYHFGLYSFSEGNFLIGRDVFKKLKELMSENHRIEWRAIGGNPVIKHYEKFCKKYNGETLIIHDACMDKKGKYVDEYIFNIVTEREE